VLVPITFFLINVLQTYIEKIYWYRKVTLAVCYLAAADRKTPSQQTSKIAE
jgi:hypothetical protein